MPREKVLAEIHALFSEYDSNAVDTSSIDEFLGVQMIVLLLDHEYDTDNFWGTPMNRSHITDDMMESQKKQ